MRAIIRFSIVKLKNNDNLENCRDIIVKRIPDQFIPIDNSEAESMREKIISEAAKEDQAILRKGVFILYT